MTDHEDKLPEYEQPPLSNGAFGFLTTSGELEVVKGEPPAPEKENEESE